MILCPVNPMSQHVPLPDQDAQERALPGTLVWEEDMQMSSNFLDKKVST